MKFTGHVTVEESNGVTLVTVSDYELFDFLEDHFLDLGMETTRIDPPAPVSSYQLLFPIGITRVTIMRALESVGGAEIERIVAINSGTKIIGPGA